MAPRIFIMNDEQAILDLYQLLFEPEGYEVHTALFPFERVQDVEQLNPSLIILDLKFGHYAQGLQLLQQLKMYRPTAHIPLIVCTAAVQEVREQEEIICEKGIPVIYKPFNIDELLATVCQALSSSDEPSALH